MYKLISLLTRTGLLIVVLGGAYAPAQTNVGNFPKDKVVNKQFRVVNHGTGPGDISLGKLRGQVVVIDFFTTWCGHSRAHLPTLQKLHADSQANGLAVIGLAVEESDGVVGQFVKDNQVTFPVSTVKDPVFADFVSSRNVSVPQTLVVGRDGRIAAHFVGYNSDVANELSAAVGRELAKR
jgi:thiol-disulfide isomerase/thioredoxin